MSKKLGGPQNLAIHPKIADPFQNQQVFKNQVYKINKNQIIYASLNLDKMTRLKSDMI